MSPEEMEVRVLDIPDECVVITGMIAMVMVVIPAVVLVPSATETWKPGMAVLIEKQDRATQAELVDAKALGASDKGAVESGLPEILKVAIPAAVLVTPLTGICATGMPLAAPSKHGDRLDQTEVVRGGTCDTIQFLSCDGIFPTSSTSTEAQSPSDSIDGVSAR